MNDLGSIMNIGNNIAFDDCTGKETCVEESCGKEGESDPMRLIQDSPIQFLRCQLLHIYTCSFPNNHQNL
ncbi:hypothetical protein L6452_24620 [Arctium lappa]|uniref:Uncharacterized protein n=1 Tax=Arctium lappa TaxID=4217 RepID=A0ACB9A9T4_ARCLA|nr:hypothetical protein L6452_24620 [Arctium lappa]